MKRTLIAISALLAMLGAVCGHLGCARGTASTRTPAGTATIPLSSTPRPAIAARSTATPTSKAASEQERAAETFSIVFYTNIILSDFRIFHLLSTGEAEFTRYGRADRIWMHRQGDVGADRADELFRFLEQKGFYELDDEYDIYPLPTDEPPIAYEDWYYAVKVSSAARPDATVVSHEKALPADLELIVNRLHETISTLPERPAEGSYLLAGDYEILRCKRRARNEPTLRLEEGGLEAYPVLREALQNPYSLVEIETLEGTRLGDLLTEDAESLEVVLGEERFVVFRLEAQSTAAE